MATQTDLVLKSGATTIKNETVQGANTALRVGTLLEDIVDSKANIVLLDNYVPKATTITINGTTLDLSANRSFSVGTVTSVGLSLPNIFSVSGSPVTGLGTITASLASQTANTVFAAPNGVAGSPAFRTLVAADIPSLDAAKITTGTFAAGLIPTLDLATKTSGTLTVSRGGTGATTLTGIMVGNGTGTVTAVAGTASQLLRRNSGNTAYEFFTHDFVNAAGARSSISLTTTGTSGVATYSSATGVLNIPNYTYTHPTFTAYSPTLTGANVLATLTTNTNGHVTGVTTRALTIGDIGAAAASHTHTAGDISGGTFGTGNYFMTGDLVVGSTTPQGYKFSVIGNSAFSGSVIIDNALTVNADTLIRPTSTTSNALNIKGLAGQTGVDLLVITTSTGTEVHKFDVFGNSLQLGNAGVFGQIYSPVNNIGSVGTGTSNINWDLGNTQQLTLIGNPTLTFSNPQSGASYQLIIVQDVTGGRTITLPSGILWENKIVPTLTGTANSMDIITLIYNGANYIGTISKNHGTL